MAGLGMFSDNYYRLWVEVFAVNVGVGDSTIIVLLGNLQQYGRSMVLNAVLIDGGYASYDDNGSVVKLATLLSFTIPNIYREPAPVKLDSLIITHWHADHYSGVIGLLSADIQAQIIATRLHLLPGQRATLDQVNGFIPTDLEASNVRCSHLKYGAMGQPLTVLYVPSTLEFPGPPFTLLFNHTNGTVDLNIWTKDEPRLVRGICRFITNADEILGANVFTHHPPPPPRSYASPAALAAAHVNQYRIGTCPGLFIVASNNKIIPAAPPVGPPPIPDFFPPTNNTSIVCLVIFPGPGGRVSYYLAGDAAGDLELRVAAWVRVNVTTMKLSHHGSASSSPLRLLEIYRPRTILVSAGDKYGHPSWQILLLLAWYSNTAASRLLEKFLWPLRYPYWLRRDEGGTFLPFPNSVDDMRRILTEPETPFQADLLRLRSPIDALYVRRVMTDLTLSDDDLKRQISRWISWHWERMSFVDVHSTYPNGALYSGEQLDTHTYGAAKEVHYVRVQCDRVDFQDGRAGGSSRDKPDIEQLYLRLDLRLWAPREPPPPMTIVTRSRARLLYRSAPVPSPAEARWLRLQARVRRMRTLDPLVPGTGARRSRRSRFVVAAAPVLELVSALPALSLEALPVLSLEALPVVLPQAPPTSYFIYSTDQQPPSTSAGSTVIPATGGLNGFLEALVTGIIMLEAGPPTTSTSTSASSKFLIQDEWAGWMIQSLQARSLSVVWNSSGGVEGFAVEFQLPLNLRYVTTATILGSPGPATPALGLLDLGIMVFGLEMPPNTGLNCSLANVLDFTGFPTSGLYGLTSTIRLVLDTSTRNRNAIWFWPDANYETTVRLQFTLDPDEALTVSSFVKNTLGTNLTITGVKVIARRVAHSWDLDTEQRIRLSSELIFSMTVVHPDAQFQGYLIFDQDYATIVIRPSPAFTFQVILAWIAGLVGNDTVDVDEVMGWVPVNPSSIRVVQIKMQASSAGIRGFSMDVQMDITFGGGATAQKIPFLLKYSWQKGGGQEFSGSLWNPPMPQVTPPDILPEYEDYRVLAPVGTGLSSELLLKNLLLGGRGLPDRPAELETVIDQLSVTLSAGRIELEGSIIQRSDMTPDTFVFTMVEVKLSATFDTATSDYLVYLSTRITLPPSTVGAPTILFASIKYDKATRSTTLIGSVAHLNMGSLVQFFPDADGSVVMDIMEHIELRELGLTYEYSAGKGTSFAVKASLVIDVFELDMNFTRDSGGWDLDASLKPAPGIRSSIKGILKSLSSDSSIADLIPPFADFEFMGDDIGAPDGGSGTTTSGLYLKVSKSNDFLTFRLSLLLKGSGNNPTLRFTFFQIKRLGDATADLPLKRIVRISVESLPFGSNLSVPLVGQLNQPFDELDYLWIHDPSEKGLTWEEIQSINSDAADFGELRYKETKLPKDLVPGDILLAAGSHFIVMMRHPAQNTPPSVVLDYVFGRPTDPPENPENSGDPPEDPENSGSANPPAQTGAAPTLPTGTTTNPEPTKGDTTMAKLQKSQGPLSIANFGLRYSNKTLHIVFDATVKLGPIEFSLLGFGLSLQFTENVSLRSLSGARFGVEISGLAVAFDKPPTLIEGMFLRESTAEVERYTGGVVVSFAPYSFQAVGSYGELRRSGTKFVFIFGKLNGPLITLGFAEITGISLGFGYNTRLRLPTLDNVNTFPFLKPSPPPAGTPDPGPLQLLTAFTGTDWITPQEGSFWIAAGLEMRAFQCLDIDAVVTLQFEPEVTIGIVAKAIASLPTSETPDPTKSFVYAEIGLVATLNVHAGVLRVEAKLSPNSFVLNPACHLRGGFALCYWFLGSGHEGDWVFSVGGYHPAFTPPAHYPVPERLGISWNLDDHLSVTGEAYFAITPKVCMGGGSLSAVFSLSPLYAYFHAYADFLINYSPFHFLGSVGVSVGVHFTIDLWICTIDIHVDVSASLDLYGPPLGGVVHVNFYVFGFSVHFGDDSSANDAITLAEFWYLAQQQTASDKAAVAAIAATASGNSKSEHVLSVVTGRYPGKNKSTETPEGAPWVVRRGGFKFSAQSQFPIRTAICNQGPQVEHQTAIYAKPMHLVGGSSDRSDENGGQWIESTMAISVVEGTVHVPGFTCAPIVKKVPSALWGKYIAGEDPRVAGSNTQNLLTHNDDLTIDLMMGVTISAPPPFLSLDLVKPFEAARAMAKDVFADADPFHPELPLTPLPVAAGPWRAEPLETAADMPAKPWEKARDVWSTSTTGDKDIKALVDACVGAFGWTLDLSPAAHIPQLLIDTLETEYLQPPLIGVGAVP